MSLRKNQILFFTLLPLGVGFALSGISCGTSSQSANEPIGIRNGKADQIVNKTLSCEDSCMTTVWEDKEYCGCDLICEINNDCCNDKAVFCQSCLFGPDEMDTMPTPTIEDLQSGVCYKIGLYSFEAKLTTNTDRAALQLAISPYQKYKIRKWFLARDLNSWWPDINHDNANQLNKSWYHQELPLVWDQSLSFTESIHTNALIFEIRTDDFFGWGHLNVMAGPALDVVRKVFIKVFIDAYEEQLKVLLETSPVREVAWTDVLREIPKADTMEEIGRAYVKRYLNPTYLLSGNFTEYYQKAFEGKELPYFQLQNTIPPLEDHALIVVHTTKSFDEDATAKSGSDFIVNHFKSKDLPVVYLVHLSEDFRWYVEDLEPTHAYFSAGGEHDIQLDGTNEVTVVGGFFGDSNMEAGCQHRAWLDFIYNYFEMGQNPSPLIINMYVPAMYFYEDDGFSPSNNVEQFRNLHKSEHMMSDGDLDALPYNRFTPRILRDHYNYKYFFNGILEETYDNNSEKEIQIKFWDTLSE